MPLPVIVNENGAAAQSMYDVYAVSKHSGLMKFEESSLACKAFGGDVAYPAILNAARIGGLSDAPLDGYQMANHTPLLVQSCQAVLRNVSAYQSLRVQEADAFCFKQMKVAEDVMHQYSKDVAREKARALTFIEEKSSEVSRVNMVPVLSMYDLETGKHVRDYYGPNSEKENYCQR